MNPLDLALLFIRLVLGAVFVVQGVQKLVNRSSSGLTAFAELGGGVLVFLGLMAPLGAALLISPLLVEILTVRGKDDFSNTDTAYEINLTLIGLALMLVVVGAGSASLDNAVGMAVPITMLPFWVVAVFVLVAVSGPLSAELSKRSESDDQPYSVENVTERHRPTMSVG